MHPILAVVLPKIIDNVMKSLAKPESPTKTDLKTSVAGSVTASAAVAVGTGAISTGDPVFDLVMTMLSATVSYILFVYRKHD